MTDRRRIAFVTRELHPFQGGGIAPIVAALASELAPATDVTLLTTAHHRARCEALGGPEALYGPGVEIVFAEEPAPESLGGFSSYIHAWSANLLDALGAHFGDARLDLIEFCDYLGEGFATIQARRTGEQFLQNTRIAVRTHTTSELTAVLNGALRQDVETLAVGEVERYCLRHADVLLHSGGDVRGTYERFYGRDRLAPSRRVLEAFHNDFRPSAALEAQRRDDPEPDGVRLLYVGRLERRKGVHNLVRALRRTALDGWSMTFLGGDTDTSPLGLSMREHLEMAIEGDPRFIFHAPVPRDAVGSVIEAHDVVVAPSLWECWPNVVREAFLHNRPVLATPTGGMIEMVEPGVSGWLAADASPAALLRALEHVIGNREEAATMTAGGGPRSAFDRLVDPDETRRAYAALLDERCSRARARPRGRSTVSVVVPYFRMEDHVEETLDSVAAQSRVADEVVLVNDGSLREEDRVVERLAQERGFRVVTQPNSGLGAARNLGIRMSRGRFVLPLDPDNLLEPEFLERCLAALERDESLAYVTTWSRFIDEEGEDIEGGYSPLGNWTTLVDRDNWAGDGTALIRRWVFDQGFAYDTELTSYEDWFLYRRLHHAGLYGDVIPHRLFRYRVRTGSMLRAFGLARTERIFDEMNAHLVESEMTWTPRNA